MFEFLRENYSPILDNVMFHNVSNKKQTIPTAKTYYSTPNYSNYYSKNNQESEYQVRPISFFFL